MRNPHGYLTINEPDKPLIEHDTFTCGHCNKIVIVPHKAKASDCGGFCLCCMTTICSNCEKQGSCTPFEKKLEKMEARDRMLRSIL